MNKKEIACIFCDKNNDNVVITENGYRGKQCNSCGLIYISPKPDFEDVFNLYGHDNAHISAAAHIESGYLKRLYAKHHLKIIQTHASEGTILDIGAGAGNFLDEARSVGFKPYAIEFNPAQAEHIRNNLKIPCEQTSVQRGIFDNLTFDVVYHCDVISHFFDPIAEFKAMNSVMLDGSLLVFETGNLGDVNHKHFKHYQRFQYPDHLFFFSTKNIENLLESTGFRLIKIHRFSINNELRFTNVSAKVARLIKRALSRTSASASNSGNASDNSDSQQNERRKAPKNKKTGATVIVNAYKYLTYFLRYKLGGIAPNFSAPQTLVIVAEKRQDVT